MANIYLTIVPDVTTMTSTINNNAGPASHIILGGQYLIVKRATTTDGRRTAIEKLTSGRIPLAGGTTIRKAAHKVGAAHPIIEGVRREHQLD